MKGLDIQHMPTLEEKEKNFIYYQQVVIDRKVY
jgi:hypothetical protein